MKLHLHHIEMCTKDPEHVVGLLQDQFRFQLVGFRETPSASQKVLQSGETVFIVTSRKLDEDIKISCTEFLHGEAWTNFCCKSHGVPHIDSVFNIALRVQNLSKTLESLSRNAFFEMLQKPVEVHGVKYAIIRSICGDIVHTLIEKEDSEDNAWFLPGFERLGDATLANHDKDGVTTTYLDHVAYACHPGEMNKIIKWYEEGFGMKRFMTNRNEDASEGLVIDADVGMRLKVMEFWLCSEVGVSSCHSTEKGWNTFKLVIAESLPHIKNIQIEGFLRDHSGPGLQHIGLHSSNIVKTVERMAENGVRFRMPPPTYYTHVGQLETIEAVGEDVKLLSKYGILLDDEADTFDSEDVENHNNRYLMQIFTHPIFKKKDTFFFEVIQRKGARGFGIGNVTALSRSVMAYSELMKKMEERNGESIEQMQIMC